MYCIYRLTSPSGKCYIGLTKTTVWNRWRSHVKVARGGKRHPLYDSIRKYGENAFIVEHIASSYGKQNAQTTEVRCISQIPKHLSLNISPGGEADGETASKVFWDRMRSNPEAMEAYRAKLVEAQRVRQPIPQEAADRVKKAAADWRKENPREAWAISYRASRVAARTATGTGRSKADTRTLKEKLLAKHKNVFVRRREGATRVWAGRSEEEKAAVAKKISASVAKLYDDPKHAAKVSAQLEKARAGMDREYQAERASTGLKAYWAELKADPVRYAAYMAPRTASLLRTLEKKKCG